VIGRQNMLRWMYTTTLAVAQFWMQCLLAATSAWTTWALSVPVWGAHMSYRLLEQAVEALAMLLNEHSPQQQVRGDHERQVAC